MSFWSQTSDQNRRIRTNPRSGSLFSRESSPDTDMFFESPSGFTNFPRSRLVRRLEDSELEDFSPRRTMHAFHNADQPFRSLHRRTRPNWTSSEEATGSRESSPPLDGRSGWGGLPRHSFFQRADSIPVRVTHDSCQGSRSSTPESNCSGQSHASSGRAQSDISNNDNSTNSEANGQTSMTEGVEEHAGVSAKPGRSSFTAKRQPKVHHIPILVESRDGAQTVVVTPPVSENLTTTNPTLTRPKHSESTPQRRATYPMPDLSNSSTNRTSTPPNPTLSNADDNAVPLMMADPTKPIPAVAPETLRNGSKSSSSPPPPTTQTHFQPTTTATSESSNNTDGIKNKMLEAINRVSEEVEKLKEVVEKFSGVKGDKQYMYLDEMLTRCLIALDNVFTEGNDELRAARRAMVVTVNNTIKYLEQKATGKTTKVNSANDEHNGTTNDDANDKIDSTDEVKEIAPAVMETDNCEQISVGENTKELHDNEQTQNESDGLQEKVADMQMVDEIVEVTV
ncbi:BCL-2-associated athanoprotein [Chamberlinius hualienensis]